MVKSDITFFIKTITLWICSILIVVGNAIICLRALHKVKSINSASKVFLISLQIGHLCLGLFLCIPNAIILSFTFQLSRYPWMCASYFFFSTAILAGGLMALIGVALDRFIAVLCPYIYQAKATKRNATVIVCFTWSVAVIMAIIRLYLQPYDTKSGYHFGTTSCRGQLANNTTDQTLNDTYTVLNNFTSIMTISHVSVCFIILTIVYLYLLVVSRKHAKKMALQMNAGNNETERNEMRKSQFRGIRSFLYVMTSYIIAWLPFVTILTYELIYSVQVSSNIKFVADICIYSNAYVNCIIYLRRKNDIGLVIQNELCTCCCKQTDLVEDFKA